MTPQAWLAHAHADAPSRALVHQHSKLRAFLRVPVGGNLAAADLPATQQYVRGRLVALAAGHCVAAYRWDGGGKVRVSGDDRERPWSDALPTDADILHHAFTTYLDAVLPPAKPAAPAGAPAAGGAAGANPFGGGGGLFGAKPAAAPAGGGLFGTVGGAGGGGGLFGGAGGLLGGAAGAAGAAGAPSGAAALFWEVAPARDAGGFSALHCARAAERERRKSDAVLLRNAAAGKGVEKCKARWSLLCDGVEWAVAEGEHNLWEAILLLLLHRAKHGGTLGGVDLKQELYSAFLCAVTAEGTAAAPKPASTVAYHGLLSVLHPWSKALEDLSLDAVSKKVA